MKIVLNHNPVACPRPKVTRFGTYYPKRYREFKKAISNDLKDVEELRFVVLLFIVKRPKALKKGDQILHLKRPDLDNFIKAILDGLPQEDSRIHTIFAQKRYAKYGEEPKIVLIGGSGIAQCIMSFFSLLMSYFGRVSK